MSAHILTHTHKAISLIIKSLPGRRECWVRGEMEGRGRGQMAYFHSAGRSCLRRASFPRFECPPSPPPKKIEKRGEKDLVSISTFFLLRTTMQTDGS